MRQLSEHFNLSEFCKHGSPPDDCLPLAERMCREALESIHAKYGTMPITSGYRPPDANAATGGIKTSAHQWTPERCACDFQVPGAHLPDVFDWIRKESRLALDQVILEHGANQASEKDDCIHVTFRRTMPRQMALIGETHGSGGYRQVPFIITDTSVPA
jgi:hypothetical protein